MTREEAVEKLEAFAPMVVDDTREALDMAIEALQTETKHGKWKCMADCGVTECDQCGWSIEEYFGDYNYCPNCGAKMEGDADK